METLNKFWQTLTPDGAFNALALSFGLVCAMLGMSSGVILAIGGFSALFTVFSMHQDYFMGRQRAIDLELRRMSNEQN